MIGQILPNNNERCYSNFSPTFREVNTPSDADGRHDDQRPGRGALWITRPPTYGTEKKKGMGASVLYSHSNVLVLAIYRKKK
jgi:hypothetical protein